MTEASGDAHGAAAEAGDDTSEEAEPETAETTPVSADTEDDDSNALGIVALVAGLLGLGLGGAAFARTRKSA